MKLSKRILCALEAVLDIALHAQSNSMTCAELTMRQKIAKRYLERILQDLVRADILSGHRGPKGGYHLAREQRKISLGDILRAVDEGNKKTPSLVSPLGRKIILPLNEQLSKQMLEPLDKITIADLAKQTQKTDIMKQPKALVADFNI